MASAAPLVARFSKKLARGLDGRRGLTERLTAWAASQRDPKRPLVWMHAPSVGEGLQAKPVLETLRAEHPDWQLAFTFFSPSAERLAKNLPVDIADYLPLDRPTDVNAVLDALQPTALVFSKLDVWPQLTLAAARRGVKLGLISATVSIDVRGFAGPRGSGRAPTRRSIGLARSARTTDSASSCSARAPKPSPSPATLAMTALRSARCESIPRASHSRGSAPWRARPTRSPSSRAPPGRPMKPSCCPRSPTC
jgi:hypothetical protein